MADMELDMVADMEVRKVADKVADMEVDKVAKPIVSSLKCFKKCVGRLMQSLPEKSVIHHTNVLIDAKAIRAVRSQTKAWHQFILHGSKLSGDAHFTRASRVYYGRISKKNSGWLLNIRHGW